MMLLRFVKNCIVAIGMFVVLVGVSMAGNPIGSYAQSCRNTSVNGNSLASSCNDRGGNFRATTLSSFDLCVGDISNDNGSLVCSKGNLPPTGSYMRSCEVTSVNGTTLHSNCRDRNSAVHSTDLPGVNQCIGDIFNDDGVLHCSKGHVPAIGPYQSSCENIFVDGSMLRAACKMRSGRLISAELREFDQCRGEIENINGVLDCPHGTADAPRGSYRQTCRQVFVSEGRVTADCLSMNGAWIKSNLELNGCLGLVRNIDGIMTCDRGSSAAPEGSYLQTCRDVVTHGSVIHALCRKIDGHFVPAEINGSTCDPGRIDNIDGQLRCKANLWRSNLKLDTQDICIGSPIPIGWIIVDRKWSSAACGNPETIIDNIMTVRKYDELPVDTVLEVCAGQVVPHGWVLVDRKWSPAICGRPVVNTNNVDVIRHSNQ